MDPSNKIIGEANGIISLNIGTESHQVKINLGKRFAITQELRDTIHHHKEMDFRLV
ncbi:MAG: hypothetical protein ACPGXY_02025 [Alphaproteobacteria bacterium]